MCVRAYACTTCELAHVHLANQAWVCYSENKPNGERRERQPYNGGHEDTRNAIRKSLDGSLDIKREKRTVKKLEKDVGEG